MSRISQELAKNIAKKLTEKTLSNVNLLKKQYCDFVTKCYVNQMPKDVFDAYNKNPQWFYTRRCIDFKGHGFNYESVSSEPVVSNCSGDAILELTPKLAADIMKLKRIKDKASDDYKTLLSETEQALLSCRTFKNIEENIPAAKPFLPPPTSNALMVNFDSINRKINNQPELTTN